MEIKSSLEMIGKDTIRSDFFFSESKYSQVHKYSVFPEVQQVPNDLYKEQKICNVCKCKLAEIGVISKKKYFCMFCFNAVCKACSPLKSNHPGTLKEERVCMECYFFAVENQVRKENATEIEILESENENENNIIREHLELSLKTSRSEIGALETQITAATEEIEKLELINKSISDRKTIKIQENESIRLQEIQNLKDAIKKTELEINNSNEILNNQDLCIEKMKAEILEKKIEIEKTQKEIETESLKYTKSEFTPVDTEIDKQKYLDELSLLKKLIADLNSQQTQLEKQLSNKLKK
jgi:hypothetical protein